MPVHENGTREVVRKSVADNGAVTIPPDGSAKLEIVNNSKQFADVPAASWAAGRGIIEGYGNGWFGPNDNITREQLPVMLWRYAGCPAATERELHFADAHRASDWALGALRWATESGIIKGKGGILDPTGQATRAETAWPKPRRFLNALLFKDAVLRLPPSQGGHSFLTSSRLWCGCACQAPCKR